MKSRREWRGGGISVKFLGGVLVFWRFFMV